MSKNEDDFPTAMVQAIRGKAMLGAGAAGAAAGVGVGNTIIAAGLGAACSPFALVPVLAGGAAYGVYKVFDLFLKQD